MTRHTWITALLTIAITAAAGLQGGGCPSPKKDPVVLVPTTMPPQALVVTLRCPPGHYLRGGRHVWQDSRWKWTDPVCTPRPDNWRDGCVWNRGLWQRQDGRLVHRKGRLVCPTNRKKP
ncbi:MAG: hypothetical protein ABI333_09735 [bacterium]